MLAQERIRDIEPWSLIMYNASALCIAVSLALEGENVARTRACAGSWPRSWASSLRMRQWPCTSAPETGKT